MKVVIESAIYLALWNAAQEANVDDLLLVPPNETFEPPVQGGILQPFVLFSDTRNDNAQMDLSGEFTLRRGVLILTVCWPVARAVNTSALFQMAGRLASGFPANARLKSHLACLRVERAPDVFAPYREGAYIQTPVNISWRTD